MSIKVIYDSYSDVCKDYVYGKRFLDEPEIVIERLNEHFDGVDFAGILDHGEYEQLMNEDRLSAYVEENEDEIVSRLEDSYIFLGHEGDSWYFLQ